MKSFARNNLSSAALRRGILVSSLALAAGVALMPGEPLLFLGCLSQSRRKPKWRRLIHFSKTTIAQTM